MTTATKEYTMPTSDCDVIARAALDPDTARQFDLPWLVQYPDGSIHQFETEDQACTFQRAWRIDNNLDPMTGLTASVSDA